MHIEGPVTRLPKSAAPGFWTGLRACLILMLGAGMICATALSAQAPAKKAAAPAVQVGNTPAGATFVGSDTCATCHDEVSKKFADNPHQKMLQLHGNASGVTCENCHGAGSEHVAGGGDVTKIFNPAKHSAKEVIAKCETCHAETHPDFDRSPHAKANISCISCHSVHGPSSDSAAKEKLLKAPQPTLCFQCHADQRSQFNMPFHHKVNEGLVKCTDCHDVHGTFGNNNLKSTVDANMICTKCHTEVRGPFVFEHAPVKAETCLGCHTPHGSQNARLLNMPNINVLCKQCHSTVAADSVHGISSGSSDLIPCTGCHTYIHGSNLSGAFLR